MSTQQDYRIAAAARSQAVRQAQADEQQLRQFLAGRPLHEQVRVIVERHPGGVTKLRIRDWSEVTLTEVTRVAQGITTWGRQLLNQEPRS